jgi:hypothetical protein
VPLVHVFLEPAHDLGICLGGWRAAERAALVVLPALDGAWRAKILAAALVEDEFFRFDGK